MAQEILKQHERLEELAVVSVKALELASMSTAGEGEIRSGIPDSGGALRRSARARTGVSFEV